MSVGDNPNQPYKEDRRQYTTYGALVPNDYDEEDFTYTNAITPIEYTIRVKKHHPLANIKILPQGDWVDLSIVEEAVMAEGDYKPLSFGFALELPKGYEAHVLPRGSTFRKFGILLGNSMGIIDNSYCGNDDIWMLNAYATRSIVIPAGEAIAQFRIVKKQEVLKFVYVDDLGNENRGRDGSTDKKENK